VNGDFHGRDYYGRGHMFLHAIEGDGASGTAYVQARDDSGTSSIGLTFRTQSAGSHRATMVLQPGGDVGIGNLSLLPGRRLGTEMADSATLDIPGTNGFIGIWDNMEVSSSVYVHGDIHREYNGAWYKLGNLQGHNYGVYWESSDQRLKKEIAPLTGALDTLGQIRGVSYLWNEAGLQHLTRGIEESWASKSGTEADNKKLWAEKRAEAAKELSRRQTGFIAQELEKVFPSWVRTDEKGFKQIDVHSMAAVLVQGVNELSAQNKEQAAALAEMEKTNAALKARVAELEAAAKAGDARLTKLETTTANLAALLEKQTSATTAGVSTASAGR
jgi:Chaperone of endosialidase